ncbi:hypothetical protein [Dyadobacter sandarakinus]|uniref:HTH cro/C1-type domain-containing protein n=1 Tax=Dyadobacter sandarakinus TaxID=2747268 RepID=A0ABX7I127_9BACT|nr:hypothetical protein [Dyadobacter sandarakinus]QRQ99763.1 hypothetical protein HWI92_01925 [Dyadobacter sandarakinus]
MNIGLTLRKIRKIKDLPIKYIAYVSGTSVSNIGLAETAKLPRQESLMRHCNALKIPIAAVLLHTVNEDEIPPEHIDSFRKLKEDILK